MSELQDLVTFEIDGQYRPIKRETIRCTLTINDRSTFSGDLISETGVYRPAKREEVQVQELIGSPPTPLFGGLVQKTIEKGLEDVPDEPIAVRVNCVDFYAFTERRYVTETFAAGTTLLQILQTLVTYVDAYGVTLDPAQVTGPTFTHEIVFQTKRLDACFTDLVNITDFICEINGAKVLRMYAVGTDLAPFNVAEGANGDINGDVTVESGEDEFKNRVVMLAGEGTRSVEDERHEGDGATRIFPLDTKIVEINGVPQGPILLTTWDGSVSPATSSGGFLVHWVGEGLNTEWEYDPDLGPTGSLVQRNDQPLLDVGDFLTVNYPGAFPMVVVADGSFSPADPAVDEVVLEDKTLFNRAQAQAIADAELARRLLSNSSRIVRFPTYRPGLRVGQLITVTASCRNLSNAECLIVELTLRDDGSDTFRYDVTCVDGAQRGKWQDFWRRFKKGNAATTATQVVMVGTPAGTLAPVSAASGVDFVGHGHPQGIQNGDPGQMYRDLDTGWLYRKQAGTGLWGWYPIVDFAGSGAANLASGWVISQGANENTNSFGVSSQGGNGGVAGEAPKFQPDGLYRSFKTLASQYTLYGKTVDPGFTVTHTRMAFQFDWDLVVRIVTDPSSLSAMQYWFGVASQDPVPSTNTAGGHCIWFRYSTTASDPGWVGVTNDNTGQSVTGLVGAIAVNTAYVLRIRKVGGTVYFSVNDGAEVSTTTKVPSAHNAPYFAAYVAITTASPGLFDERAFFLGRAGATIAEFAA